LINRSIISIIEYRNRLSPKNNRLIVAALGSYSMHSSNGAEGKHGNRFDGDYFVVK